MGTNYLGLSTFSAGISRFVRDLPSRGGKDCQIVAKPQKMEIPQYVYGLSKGPTNAFSPLKRLKSRSISGVLAHANGEQPKPNRRSN